MFFGFRQLIVERALALRLPVMYFFPDMAQDAAYGPDLIYVWRDIHARQLIQLLRGADQRLDPTISDPMHFNCRSGNH